MLKTDKITVITMLYVDSIYITFLSKSINFIKYLVESLGHLKNNFLKYLIVKFDFNIISNLQSKCKSLSKIFNKLLRIISESSESNEVAFDDLLD